MEKFNVRTENKIMNRINTSLRNTASPQKQLKNRTSVKFY